MRGGFIVLEGLDRAGKTSQCASIVSYLKEQGKEVVHYRFPNRDTKIGKVLDEFLRGANNLPAEAIHLLFTANRWEMQEIIRQDLMAGKFVITDRYLFSGVAYTTAAWGKCRDWCSQVEEDLILPDLTLYLDITPEVAASRGGYGGERYEKVEIQKKVRNEFAKFAYLPGWETIDASKSQTEVFDAIQGKIDTLMNEIPTEIPLYFSEHKTKKNC